MADSKVKEHAPVIRNSRHSTFDIRHSTFDLRHSTFDLFLISFLVLFFELACIRWFGSMVIFLTFFTNLVLIASFLGMTVGCLAASRRANLVYASIPLAFVTSALAWAALHIYLTYTKVTVDVGRQESPQQIYFGTEYRAINPGQIVIPMEVIAGLFFVLIALVFVGMGQVLGRALDSVPNRLKAYTANIAGSLAGIVSFSIAAYLRTSPFVWFLVSVLLCLYFVYRSPRPDRQSGVSRLQPPARNHGLQITAAIGVVAVAGLSGWGFGVKGQTLWSPYYKIVYQPETGDIDTNNIAHQRMVSVAQEGPAYVLPYLLNRDAGGKPFSKVLIIGAGSGNDVQSALSHGAGRVHAVEIDPVLYAIGEANHPDHPYHDPRVTAYLEDGRSFLKRTGRKYDLVIYALVDSLALHSSYSSLRLESFLFTRQAFEEIKAKLKPDGVFAMYNYYRQGWVVGRLEKMAEEVFGTKPIVVSLPYQERITPSDSQKNHITFLMVGATDAIARAFQEKKFFWLNAIPKRNDSVNAFGPLPPASGTAGELRKEETSERKEAAIGDWKRIGTAAVDTRGIYLLPSDDWPFIYLKDRKIPALNQRGMVMVAALSALILFLFAPVRTIRFNWQFFFLGTGFMLLETKSVVHMALLFGATWIVNSVVLFSILLMILLSNLWVLWINARNLWTYYGLLGCALLANTLVPMETFLALPGAWRVAASCSLIFVPIFFAGVIFAALFRQSSQPDVDFGANIAGAVLGGLCEYFSLVVGFRYLLVIAIGFYFLSAVTGRRPVLRPLGAP